MQIHHLQLNTTHLQAQFDFYANTIGFNCQWISDTAFQLITQENTITFQYNPNPTYYHFAFLIPTGTLESAIDFIEAKGIELLPFQGKPIIQFTDGRSIYFYDKDQNIAEFIERPLLDYPKASNFSIEQIIKLNEIGLPVAEPVSMANTLVRDYGVQASNNPPFSENFCWVGDHHGVLIVTKLGRNWLPTQYPGIVNDFKVHYSDQGKPFKLSFENNEIIEEDWV